MTESVWCSVDIAKLSSEEFQLLHDIGSYTGTPPRLEVREQEPRALFRLTTWFVHGKEKPLLCEWPIEGTELVVLLRCSKNRVMLDHRRDAKPETLER